MNTAEFSTFLGFAGLLGVLIGSLLVRRRLIAEREMVRSLRSLLYGHHLPGREREEIKATIDRFEVDAEPMAHLAEEATRRLAESDRTLVLRALRQDSEQGRKAYMRKLIRQAQLANAS